MLAIFPILRQQGLRANQSERPPLAFWRSCRQAWFGALIMIVSGVYLGVMYSLYPYYLALRGLHDNSIAWAMALTLAGAGLCQWPVGRLANRFGVSRLLSIDFIAIVVVISAIHFASNMWLIPLSILLGGGAFLFYPLAVSLLTADVRGNAMVARVSVGAILYSLGAAIGPIMVTPLLTWMGQDGLIVFMVMFSLILAVCSWCCR